MARTTKNSKTSSKTTTKVSSSTPTSNGLNFDFQNNRSVVNLILGAAVLVVLAVLVFNFLTNQKQSNPGNLGPTQQTENTPPPGDVAVSDLPGTYTVKAGDTLFLIAQKYYNDGYQYPQIVKANQIVDENKLEVGQVLTIPKIDNTIAQASPEASMAPMATDMPMASDQAMTQQTGQVDGSQNTAASTTNSDQTVWGTKITAGTYTVQPGDWLSKIAGRSYGDIMSYNKIAQANNIKNPNLIEPGTVLTIPR